ncbi:aspartate/glutamate racemase family protein [uncultured Moraxella sp.]|uniref:aspartate/glutamate racemase family protein n=1 Tax=uncultured Moraxella sp. TaxID=263769 RepID=UPI0025F999D4|nr:aspartate/glutamate racemase family protein [uncultured Moraxella sp.]
MKTLGIIGGMSPASTVLYYQSINQLVNQACGANTSAPLLIDSLNFEVIANLQRQGDWQAMGRILANSAKRLCEMGADGILLATNTMHKVADDIQAVIDVPFIHIVDATAGTISQQGITRVALLGTAFTMSETFYRDKLAEFGIECIVPTPSEQAVIHQIIFDELTLGVVRDESKRAYLTIIQALLKKGAQAVVLGCTEIGLLINEADVPVPVFDTAQIHAMAGATFILSSV